MSHRKPVTICVVEQEQSAVASEIAASGFGEVTVHRAVWERDVEGLLAGEPPDVLVLVDSGADLGRSFGNLEARAMARRPGIRVVRHFPRQIEPAAGARRDEDSEFRERMATEIENVRLRWELQQRKAGALFEGASEVSVEAQLRRVLDALFGFVGLMTPDGTLIEANRAPLVAAGIGAEDVIGKKFWDCHWWNYSPEIRSQLMEACDRARLGEVVRYDVPVRMAGGVLMWIDFQIAPLRDEQGRITHLVPSAMDIEQRRRTEERLQREQAFLEAVLEASSAGIVVANAQGKILRMNPANERLWGLAPGSESQSDHAEWKGWWADGSARNGQRLDADDWAMARALRGQTSSAGVVEIQPFGAPGVRKTILDSGAPVRSGGGEIIGGVVVQMDITEWRLAQEALDEHRRLYKSVTDNASVALFIMDERQHCVFMNPAAEKLTGYSIEETRGKALHDVLHHTRPDGTPYPLSECPIDQAFPENNQEQGTEVFVHRDGHFYDVAFTASPIRDKEGKPAGTVIEVREITEERRAAEALRASEERFRAMADHIAPLAWMADREGWIFWYNKQWHEYTGMTLEEVQGWGWRTVHHPDHIDRVTRRWQEHLRECRRWEDLFPLRRFDGQWRWFLSRAQPIRDEKNEITLWFGTNTDVTELRETQQALQKAQAELQEHATQLERTVEERTAKLREAIADLEHFSHTITHDLRTPLRAMRAFGELLEEEFSSCLNEEGRSHLRRIGQAAVRMDALITDTLHYSKAVRTELLLGPLDPGPLLRGMIESYPQFQPPSAIVEADESFPAVIANEAALSQCFSNLLGNAVKFVQPGKTPHVQVRSELRGEVVRLWFKDNGIGIPDAHKDRLFVMFQRLNTNFEGTGVGLALVRRVVQSMNGKVGFESTPGVGTNFWIDLKRAPVAEPDSAGGQIPR